MKFTKHVASLELARIEAGHHSAAKKVTIRKTGYNDYTVTVTLYSDEEAKARAREAFAKQYGHLTAK